MSKTDAGNDRQEQAPRPRRRVWVVLVLILVAAQGLYYLTQGFESPSGSENLQAMVKAMGSRNVEADREFAARMEAQQRDSPLRDFGPERAADAAARSALRAWVVAAIGTIDEALARRERILNETIARIEAARASDKAKSTMLAAIRDATAQKVPLSVQMMKAMRAYLEKIGEMVAHLESNAPGLSLRDGQLAFEDGAAADRHNALEDERVALEKELQRLQQEVRKLRP
jgi:hypothetical protein